jgi:hypothetical protein
VCRVMSLWPCNDIDFLTGKLHVRRSKGGTPSVHTIGGRDLRVSIISGHLPNRRERLEPARAADVQAAVGTRPATTAATTNSTA